MGEMFSHVYCLLSACADSLAPFCKKNSVSRELGSSCLGSVGCFFFFSVNGCVSIVYKIVFYYC